MTTDNSHDQAGTGGRPDGPGGVEVRPLRECVVVVTPRSFGMHDPGLRHRLEEEVGTVRYCPGPLAAAALAQAVADADGLLCGLDEVSAEVFAAAPRLRAVARYGVGVDRVDLHEAALHGVTVTVTPGANANAVAELTIALLFALARPVVVGHDRARAGQWPALSGVELTGRTLGLIGLGRIGSLVAAKAASLGLRVLAHDPNVSVSETGTLVDLGTLVAESDFVSLHAPLTDQTRGMVSRSLLERFKPGSGLINTARGALIDEAGLLWALEEGPLRAAALDVLVEEPPPVGSPLLQRDDVLVTPHMGPHTAEATSAMGAMALDDLLAVLQGRAPKYPL
ncbi:MAG: phosphoglycerate dehydrogenase [Acidimicrobiales bacterium]